MRRRRRCQPANRLAKSKNVRRPFLRQFWHGQRGEKINRKPALIGAIMPADGGIVDAGDQLPCHLIIQIILIFANNGRLFPDFGLVAVDPQALREHPLRRDGALSTIVHLQGRLARGKNGVGFGIGSHIHPYDGVAQRTHLRIQRDHRTAGCVRCQAKNFVLADVTLSKGASHRHAKRAPPVIGALLCPAGPRKACRVFLRGEHHRGAIKRKDADTNTFCAAVNAHQIFLVGHVCAPICLL